MLIGNLPEDTSISDNGYVLYSEDGQHCSKMSIKNLNGGGAGLKYWKETDNTIYRVQHNEGQWLFDEHFKVPGAAEIIVAATFWDLQEGGADRYMTTPILVGHEDPETHEIWYTEEDGPEVAYLHGRVKHYYIFRRMSNKVVMGGTLWYKFWGTEPLESRLADEEYGGNSRYRYNLPGWLLMSTDKDTLTYQLVEIDPWSYDQMSATVQERIDNGFFTYEHMPDKTISTIAPIDTPVTHLATGTAFYINGVPDPEIYEPLVINAYSSTPPYGDDNYFVNYAPTYAYIPPEDADPSTHPYADVINLYTGGDGSYYDDNMHPKYSTWPIHNSENTWQNWVLNYVRDPIGSNHSIYERVSKARFAAYDDKVQSGYIPQDVGFPENIKGPYLAYFGAVYNYTGIPYEGTVSDHGKTAVEYPFTDGGIQCPQGYFTGIATGFATKGKVFYAGMTTDEYDEPQVDQANVWVDSEGNIVGESLSVNGQILSDDTPVIGRISPTLQQGTKIADIYPTGSSTSTPLYAPSGGGGGGSIVRTRLWSNPKSGYQRQVEQAELSEYPGEHNALVFFIRSDYGNNSSSFFYYYIFMDCYFGAKVYMPTDVILNNKVSTMGAVLVDKNTSKIVMFDYISGTQAYCLAIDSLDF